MLKIFSLAAHPEFQIYWYLLQAIALLLPLNNVLTPLLGGVLILLFLIRQVSRQGWQSLDTVINRGWLGLSVWLVITTFTAFDPAIAWTGLFNFLPFFLLFAIASLVIQTTSQFVHILRLLVIGSLPVSILGILQVVINQPNWRWPRLFGSYEINLGMSPDHRITSLFGHYNEMGIYLAVVLIIASHFVLRSLQFSHKGGLEKYWAWIVWGLGIIALWYSGSRNAWTLVAIGLFCLAVYYRHWYVVGALILAVILLSWAVWGNSLGIGGEWLRFIFPQGLINRLESTVNPNSSDYLSTINRFNAWKFAIDLIQMHPIQGWGLRSFEAIANSMGYNLQGLPHEHNFYLTLAVGGGIPTLIGYMGLVIWIIVKGLRTQLSEPNKNLLFAVVVAIALFFLSGFLDVTFYEPRICILSWLLLATICRLQESGSVTDFWKSQ